MAARATFPSPEFVQTLMEVYSGMDPSELDRAYCTAFSAVQDAERMDRISRNEYTRSVLVEARGDLMAIRALRARLHGGIN